MSSKVDWRFGEQYYVQEFVQTHNPDIEAVYADLKSDDNDTFVLKTARWIRENFKYPFDINKNPSAGAQFLRYPRGMFSGYCWKKCMNYIWGFPNETFITGRGICIDTSLLTCSVLRTKPASNAFVALGSVRETETGKPISYHAWQRMPYRGKDYLIETTIHDVQRANLLPLDVAYDRDSNFAKQGGIYYDEDFRFNEKEEFGNSNLGAGVVALIGQPASPEFLSTKKNQKGFYKEWLKEEVCKLERLSEVFGYAGEK